MSGSRPHSGPAIGLAVLSLSMSIALLRCGSSPPVVQLVLEDGAGVAPISGLHRLSLRVYGCEGDAILARDLPVTGAATELDGALRPGQPFYVRLQGWVACQQGTACRPAGQPGGEPCVCVDDPGAPAQRLTSEACSDWLTAKEDIEVALVLERPPGACPPERPEACETP